MLTEGSGLLKILAEIYGKNTVNQMLSGKSILQAFGEHFLVDKCLPTHIAQ